jgi:hypothetical protein
MTDNHRGAQWISQGENAKTAEIERNREHRCHALGCTVPVPPQMLMCRTHWFKVPKPLRQAVWSLYQRGQEVTKTPTPEYLAAARRAIDAVAEREGRTQGVLL